MYTSHHPPHITHHNRHHHSLTWLGLAGSAPPTTGLDRHHVTNTHSAWMARGLRGRPLATTATK